MQSNQKSIKKVLMSMTSVTLLGIVASQTPTSVQAQAVNTETPASLVTEGDSEADSEAGSEASLPESADSAKSLARDFPAQADEIQQYQDDLQKEVSEMGESEPSGSHDWVHIYETGNHNSKKYGSHIPEANQANGETAGLVLKEGPVSLKTKELIAIAISADDMCTKCITSHTINNLKEGVSRQEIAEAMGVVQLYGGGPKSVSAAWVIDAYDTLSVAYEDEIKAARVEKASQEPYVFDRKQHDNKVFQPSGETDWQGLLKETDQNLKKLAINLNETSSDFKNYYQAIMAEGALTQSQKELIALSLAVNKHSEEAIAHHVRNLLQLGLYRVEMEDALSVHFVMGGAADADMAAKALDAYDALYSTYFKDVELKKTPDTDFFNYQPQALEEGTASKPKAQSFPVNPSDLKAYQDALHLEVSKMEMWEPSGNMDWVHIYETGNHNSKKLSQLIGSVSASFGTTAESILQDGVLSNKTKELIAIAISADDMCTKCITSHTLNNLKEGVTRQEIAEAVSLVQLYGGGPKSVSAAWVIDAYDTLSLAYQDEIKEALAKKADFKPYDRSANKNEVPKASGLVDWSQVLQEAHARFEKYDSATSGVTQANQAFFDLVLQAGDVSSFEKDLIALALAVNKGSDAGIAIHVNRLLDAGAHRVEVAEALSVLFIMGGSADAVGVARALDAYDSLYHARTQEGTSQASPAIRSRAATSSAAASFDFSNPNNIAQSFPVDAEGLLAYQDALSKEVQAMGDQEPSGSHNWVHIHETGAHNSKKLGLHLPQVNNAFGKLAGTALQDGALSTKQKELIAIAITADDMCLKCTTSHTLNNLKEGVTRQEMAEAMAIVQLYGGGPKSVSAAWVIDAYDTLSLAYADEIAEGINNIEPFTAYDRKKNVNHVPQSQSSQQWIDLLEKSKENIKKVSTSIDPVDQNFRKFYQAAMSEGDLTSFEKELIGLVLAVNKGSDESMVHHIDQLIDQGAHRQEVAEALSILFFMGGAVDAINVARALDAYDALYHHKQASNDSTSPQEEVGVTSVQVGHTGHSSSPSVSDPNKGVKLGLSKTGRGKDAGQGAGSIALADASTSQATTSSETDSSTLPKTGVSQAGLMLAMTSILTGLGMVHHRKRR